MSLVQMLREGIEPYEGIKTAEEIMDRAADEIERLKAEAGTLVQRIAEGIDENKRLRRDLEIWHRNGGDVLLAAEIEWLRAALIDLREYFETGKIHGARVDANRAENIIDAALNGTAEG